MNWSELNDEIRQGKFRQAYLFSGPEEYVKREMLGKLREALLPPGLELLNEAQLEGASADRIVESLDTLPVMCDRRLVVVRDWAPLLSAKSRDEESEVQRLVGWLSKPCDSSVLVLYMRGAVDMSKGNAKAVAKAITVVTFDHLADADMRKWFTQHLKPFKKTMSPEVVRQLVLVAGNDLTLLDGELQKLVAFAGDRAEITGADIAAVVSPSTEFGAFDLLNKLFDGDAAGAYETLNLMLEHGENRVRILASITRQMRGMAHIALASGTESTEAVAGILSLNPYAARIMAQKSRRYDPEALSRMYQACVDADFSIKSGQARDQAALDLLFLKISSMPPQNAQPMGAVSRLTPDKA